MQNQPSPAAELKIHDWRSTPKLAVGVIGGLVVLAVLVGGAPLVGLSPLLFGGGVLSLFIALVYLRSPVLALYSAIFINLLPQGFPPDAIQSNGALALLFLSLVFWVLQTGFQRRKLVWTPPLLLILGFLLWAFVTILWANDLVVSRQTFVQFAIVTIIAFLMVNQVDSPAAVDGLMTALLLSGWLLIVLGLWTVFFGGYTLGDRLQIFDMNENLLGPLLMLATTGAVWRVMRAPAQTKKFWMCLSLLYIVCALALIALSGSRGSFIGFGLILLLFLMSKATRPWALWGVAIGVVGLVCAPFIFNTVLDRFTNDTEDLYGDRDVLWQASLLLLNDHPWTGVGIGNGPYIMLNYVNTVSDTDHIGQFTTRPAHNPLLEVADDTGLIGLALYLSALGSALWLFLQQFYRAWRQRAAFWSAYGALVFYISIGFISAWLKSGGLANHVTLFILLALWLIPYRMQAYPAANQASGQSVSRFTPYLPVRK
ncbi:MAG: O-antigen ligase family protein [Caldilineaceae bacterium]